jgi:hypothetical protein
MGIVRFGKDYQNAALESTAENVMTIQTGLWIDHRKAIIAIRTEKGVETALVISNVEKQLRRSGDSPLKGSYETRRVPADDSRQRAFTGHLNVYYDAVIACVRKADSILIFGPGEAKGELKDRLEKSKLGGRIAAIETADKMTDRQIAAKVREYFDQRTIGNGSAENISGRQKPDRAVPRSSSTPDRNAYYDKD